ncbi:MAG: hypothetical protein IT257_03090 [Chitinophagaceae bacterium]|nr:hypothetical protein [Chitinophagaceae bacterium]
MPLKSNQYRTALRSAAFKRILLCCCFFASLQTAPAAVKDSTEKKFDYFRIGVDLSKLLASPLAKDYNAYEFTIDLHYRRDLYLVADAGFGNSVISNTNLTYKSRNTFLRFGLDKTFFNQEYKRDLDNAFVGLRYGVSLVNRSEAEYFIKDTVWGNSSGRIQSADFTAQWLELVGGFRIELLKNIFLGWNIRARTFVNPKKFAQLPPGYIAGYGRGEKNTSFGYNFYLMIGFGSKR